MADSLYHILKSQHDQDCARLSYRKMCHQTYSSVTVEWLSLPHCIPSINMITKELIVYYT
jgi:hypothetical protein